MKPVHSSCCSLYRAMMEFRRKLGGGGGGGEGVGTNVCSLQASLVLRPLDSL